jgi:hypothetical protein
VAQYSTGAHRQRGSDLFKPPDGRLAHLVRKRRSVFGFRFAIAKLHLRLRRLTICWRRGAATSSAGLEGRCIGPKRAPVHPW